MIIILFPAGAFGSTIEYCLRQYTTELTKVNARVLDNGSMHSYNKEFHPQSLNEFLTAKNNNHEIATPVYPGEDYLTPVKTIEKFNSIIDPDQKVTVICLTTIEMAERNQLFLYHKIQDLFLNAVMKDKVNSWNPGYCSFKDMQRYELREALSFFIDQQVDHLSVIDSVRSTWLTVTPDQILYDFKNTLLKIIDYHGLTLDQSQSIDEFYQTWYNKQQYIIDEFELVSSIIDNIHNNNNTFCWNNLSIVGESMVQSRLRKQGIEIACYNLNQFPTTVSDLKKVLINE